MTPVDPALFRDLCSRFATGVVVATTSTSEGRPAGMTVSSFTSVSLDPPLVSIAIDRGAELHAALTGAPRFGLNILAAGQADLSRRFAEPLADRFAGVAYTWSPGGLPVLDGTLAFIECDCHTLVPAGDHTIILGLVTGGTSRDARPLVYYRRQYGDPGFP